MAAGRTESQGRAIHIERVGLSRVPWPELDAMADRTIGQTRPWLEFLAETQGAEPTVGRVLDGGDPIGWFSGATFRRGGVKILGSPMRGWTTAAMGFNLAPGADRTAALAALPRFAFAELGCVHLEFADRSLLDDAAVPDGFHLSHLTGYELELGGDDDALLAAMTPNGRRDVRRALRNGIEVAVVDPRRPGDFVDEHYAQLVEAFAKRGRTPTYPVERVHALVRHLGPSGHLLLLRATTADGNPAATGIFPGLPGGTAEYWAGASHRREQRHLPNEALMWTALRTWRDRGAVRMNFGGGGDYKAKYGGTPHSMPWVRRSRFELIERARTGAYSLYRGRRAVAARLRLR